jgi:hypothetical protein
MTCRKPSTTAYKLPLLTFADEQLMFWALVSVVIAYSFFVGFFVVTERCAPVPLCAMHAWIRMALWGGAYEYRSRICPVFLRPRRQPDDPLAPLLVSRRTLAHRVLGLPA